jgi:Icc-related predicted phosphoesterase
MTRLAILADIHGNLPALEAVLADLAQFPVDHVVVAGDVINWGPHSAEVMAQVLVIQEFQQARLRISPFMCWRAACRPGVPLSAELLAEFATINPWEYTPSAYHLNR